MSVVTLAEAKAHARIDDGEAYDDFFQAKIDAAEALASDYIGTSLTDADTFPDGLPASVKEAVLQLIAHFYDNRAPLVIGSGITQAVKIAPSAFDLLRPYRKWSGFGC